MDSMDEKIKFLREKMSQTFENSLGQNQDSVDAVTHQIQEHVQEYLSVHFD